MSVWRTNECYTSTYLIPNNRVFELGTQVFLQIYHEMAYGLCSALQKKILIIVAKQQWP